ncbi:hypothetical protein [Sphingomonas sp. DT-204]|uniref:hypothetical protein n=1 Tax=Sphingomonas sp. DT-204 TaxID=3396166 RepID=UPI003F1941C8
MGLVQALDGVSNAASNLVASLLSGETLPQLAAGLIAQNSPNNVPDAAAINGQLAELAQHDPAFAADLRAEISTQLRPVDRAALTQAEQAAAPLLAREAPAPSAGVKDASQWIEALRISPDPADRTLFADLARAAGSADPAAIRTLLAALSSQNLNPSVAGQQPGPGGGNVPQAQPAAPGGVEWRGQLQALLDMRAATVAIGQEGRPGAQEAGKGMTADAVNPVALPYTMGNPGPTLPSWAPLAKPGPGSSTRCRAGFAQPCPRPAAECRARRCGEAVEAGAIAAPAGRGAIAAIDRVAAVTGAEMPAAPAASRREPSRVR